MESSALTCPHCGDTSRLIACNAVKRQLLTIILGAIVVVLAVGALGICAAYVNGLLPDDAEEQVQLQSKQEPAVPAAPQMVTLLVARKDLEKHTGFRDKPQDYFVEKQFNKNVAPKEALRPADIAGLKDKFLKRPLKKDDCVTAADVMENKFWLGGLGG